MRIEALSRYLRLGGDDAVAGRDVTADTWEALAAEGEELNDDPEL